MPSVTYVPPKSLVPFFTSEKFIALAVGPVGCVDRETEFLTPKGWKKICDYKEGDLVAQWNSETDQAEFVKPLKYIRKPCGRFYHFANPGELDMMLSEEHRVVYRLRRKGEQIHECTAAEMAERHWATGAESVRIPVTFTPPEADGLPYSDDMLRLAVVVCVSGEVSPTGSVKISVKPSYKTRRLRELLEAVGAAFSVQESAKTGTKQFYFRVPFTDKSFGANWWNATRRQLSVVAEEFARWDGSYVRNTVPEFKTDNKELADFAQYAMMHRFGKTTCLPGANGVFCVKSNKTGGRTVGLSRKVKKAPLPQNRCHMTDSADGTKYCFSVPSTYLVLRRGGCIFVTGNSTKTTAGIMKIAYHAKQMAPCTDGIRRSRAVWIRNTREQLRDTSIPDFLSWFPDGVAGTFAKTSNEFLLKFDDVECLVMFRGLDDAKDVRRLLSLQVSFAIMDEFREINKEIFEAVQGRLGRYPNKMMVPPKPEWGSDENGQPIGGCVKDDGSPNAHIWGMTNPPDMETFWEEFISNPPSNCHITIQPSGLSPKADWVEFLPAGYYDNLANGKDPDWVDVYIHAKFGKSLAGMPVFRSFSRELHVSKEPLDYIRSPNSPIIIGMDAALHPAAVFGQVDYKGRVLILDEVHATGMGAMNFIREKVKPLLAKRFPGQPVVVVIDPAANTRSQTDEKTVLDIIRSEGLPVRMASTNAIQARISAVDATMTRVVDGEPWLLIDEKTCGDLIAALAGKYRYRRKTNGETEDKPDKSHPWSDICDALQYLCLHTDTSGLYNQNTSDKAVEVKQVAYRYV